MSLLGVVTAIFVGAFFANSWLQSKYYRIASCYDAKILFTFEGQPYQASSKVLTFYYRTLFGPGGRGIAQLPKWMGTRLPTGEAVLFGTPHRSMWALYTRTRDNLKDWRVLPLAYWLNDADSPTQAKAYVTERYYDQAQARLVIDNIVVRKSDDCPSNRFAFEDANWFRPEGIGWVNKDYDERGLGGVYANVLSEDDWRGVPGVREYTKKANSVSRVPDQLNAALSSLARERSDFIRWDRKELIPISGYGRYYPKPENGRKLPNQALLFSVVKADGVGHIDLRQPGVISFYKGATETEPSGERWYRNLQCGRSAWCYDPKKRIFYRLRFEPFY